MESNYLFPSKFKKIGYFLLVPTLLFTLYSLGEDFLPSLFDLKAFALMNDDFFSNEGKYLTVINENIANEIIGILGIVSLIFIAFSKEKSEDEFISKIRLDSLLWATYLNYVILILAIFFIYGSPFFWVLVFNMYTILIVFIVRFNWMNYNLKQSINNEK